MLNIKVDTHTAKIHLTKISPAILLEGIKEMKYMADRMTGYIKDQYMSAGGVSTDRSIRVRSGHLRRTTHAWGPEITDDAVSGGTAFGANYARTHVGPAGQETVIRPRNAKALTIPLAGIPGGALTSAGVIRPAYDYGMTGGARNIKGMFPIKTKAGDVILAIKKEQFRKDTETGVRHKMKDKIIPIFILKKSVTVKSRIHPERILGELGETMINSFTQAVQRGIDQV